MSQITSPGLNQRASGKFAPPPVEINPRVSVDNRFNEAGESGTLAAAADNNWISSILSRQLDRVSVKADPKFSLTVENLSDYMKGLPDEWADEFSGAGSDEEARVIRAQLKRRMSNMQTLQEAGWTGTAANLASNVVDPIAFGAGLLSGGAGWVEKGGRLARLAKAGMLAAGGTLPITAYQESQDPDGSVANTLFNTAGAFALGALGHGIGEIATGKWAIKTMKEIEARDIAMLPPGATTEKAKIAYAEELSRNRLADAIDEESARLVSESDTHADDFTGLAEAARKNELEVIDVDALDPQRTSDVEVEVPGVQKIDINEVDTAPPGGGGSGGGGKTPPQLPPPGGPLSTIVRKVRDFIAKPTDSLSAFGPVRWGMSGRLGQAPVPEVRMAASVYAQDSLARKGGEAAPYAATTWASREYRSHMAEVEREAEQHLNAYLKRNGVPAWKSFDAKVEFQKAVSWQLEGAPVGTVAPEVEAVANLHRKKYAELLDMMKRHGVPGFENVPTDPNYYPHLHNVGAVNRAIKEWGHGEVAKLYEMGMVKAGWDAADAARVAPGFLDGILNLGHFSDLDKLKFFMGDAEALKAVFKRYATGLSDADAERIAEFLKPKDAGLTPRAKRRTDLDTLVRISKTGANGQREDLWLHQLMETNAQAVLHKYTRQALGAAAEAEILRAMGLKVDPSGATTFKNFDELQDHIIRQYKAKGILTDRGPGKRDMDRLVALRKAAVGIPLHETGILSDVSRLVRAYNFIRGSGTFGIAQAVELGKLIGEIGFEPVMQQMPALRQIWKRAQNGTMTNELLAEMEEFIAAGTEGITHQVTARFNDQLGIEEFAGGGKLETLARRGEKLAGEVSGLVPITAMQQRMAGAAASQKVLNLAMSGRPLSARRLADIGLNAAMWDRIVKQVKQHATSEPGMLGRRLKRFNFDNWTDTEAGASLAASLDLWSRRVIQDSDVGAMALWMTNPSARMLVQFRTFALQAWEKQFLRGIQVRDARAFLGFALTGAFGAMAYMGQQYVGALTDKEKAKKLKKNLSAKNIALQGFARSGASSILPSMIDFTLGQFKQDPLFDSRYSGLSSRGLMSNPSFELLDSGAQFAKGLGGLVTGKPMTRSEFKAGTRLIPLQGVLGVRNGLDAIADEFPKTTK